MKKNKVRKYLVPIIVFLFLVWGFFWPMSNYIEGPGDAADLSQIVNIKNHPDRQKGQFMLTSVGIAQAHPFTYAWAKVNPYYSIVSADSVTGGQNVSEYDKVQNFYMESSINEAIYAAYKKAGKQVKRTYNGIYVLAITNNSKFRGKLKVGDVVVKIDGHHFSNANGFVNYVKGKKLGQTLSVEFKRNGHLHTVSAPLVKIANNRAGIGITLADDMQVKPEIPINVNPGDVGGPSGGLMFSLQIYSQLINQNLRHGKKVAGTGMIDSQGDVGEIGGIDKKVIAAKRKGATVFLAPYIKPTKLILKYEEDHETNYELAKKTAKKYAPNMKVIPVTSFSQAISKLQKLND
mgnify:FL=1